MKYKTAKEFWLDLSTFRRKELSEKSGQTMHRLSNVMNQHTQVGRVGIQKLINAHPDIGLHMFFDIPVWDDGKQNNRGRKMKYKTTKEFWRDLSTFRRKELSTKAGIGMPRLSNVINQYNQVGRVGIQKLINAHPDIGLHMFFDIPNWDDSE